jgi:hypothetical protein
MYKMIEKIQNFLNQEHTPLEKGLLISVALLSGIIIGFLAAPIKKGIKMWSDNGNGNGCHNTDNNALPNSKKKQKQNADFKMFTLDETQSSK